MNEALDRSPHVMGEGEGGCGKMDAQDGGAAEVRNRLNAFGNPYAYPTALLHLFKILLLCSCFALGVGEEDLVFNLAKATLNLPVESCSGMEIGPR